MLRVYKRWCLRGVRNLCVGVMFGGIILPRIFHFTTREQLEIVLYERTMKYYKPLAKQHSITYCTDNGVDRFLNACKSRTDTMIAHNSKSYQSIELYPCSYSRCTADRFVKFCDARPPFGKFTNASYDSTLLFCILTIIARHQIDCNCGVWWVKVIDEYLGLRAVVVD